MFSPILAMVSAIASATVMLPTLAALIFSTSVPTSSATSAIILHQALEQIVARDEVGLGIDLDHDALGALDGGADQAFGGDAAGLLGGLGQALLAQPVDGGFHVAVGLAERRLAIHHARAGLVAQLLDHLCGDVGHRGYPLVRYGRAQARPSLICRYGRQARRCEGAARARSLFGFGGEFLRLGDPAVDAAGQSDLFADLVGGVGAELGDLPVVEDAEIVELLLDRRRDVRRAS